MARLHGMAGEWARVNGTVTGLWPLFLGVFLLGFACALFLVSPLWAALLIVVTGLFVIYSLIRGLHHVERYFKGARGEEKVSGILSDLPASYHVFNDYVIGRTYIDHVVVGPAGVFAVETKCWNGRVTIEEGHILVDEHRPSRSPIQQVIREATLVRDALRDSGWSGLVTPVLAFASDTFVAHRADFRGVIIINSNELKDGFSKGREVLSASEVERLVGIMEARR